MTAPRPKTKSSAANFKAGAPKKPAKLLPPANLTLSRMMIGLTINVITAMGLLTYISTNQRDDIMFAVRHDDKMMRLIAADAPSASSDAVISWTKLALSEIFTYDFNNIVPRLNASRRFFNDQGWDSFRSAFHKQNVLATVTAQRQIVTTMPSGFAVILSEGDENKLYTWTVQIQYVMSTYTGQTNVSRGTATVKVVKVPSKESSAGYPFAITKITL